MKIIAFFPFVKPELEGCKDVSATACTVSRGSKFGATVTFHVNAGVKDISAATTNIHAKIGQGSMT